jgi:hypothetical protein
MYPSLGELLTSVYSICFPIDEFKKLPDEKQKALVAFERRLQRLEKDVSLPNMIIGDLLSQGAENLDTLFPVGNVPNYFCLMVREFLVVYARKYVLNFATYTDTEETRALLFGEFLPEIPETCNILYDQFSMFSESPRLPRDWYMPKNGNTREPFKSVLTWLYSRYEKTGYALAKEAKERLGISLDATKKRIQRWNSGENLPSPYECVKLLGVPDQDSKARIFAYVSIVLSHIYDSFPKQMKIEELIRTINRFGVESYLHTLDCQNPQELIDLSSSFSTILTRARKVDSTLRVEIETFLTEHKEPIKKYHFEYLSEALLGRYSFVTDSDFSKASVHLREAFNFGRYRAGRFQKQICADLLYCLRQLDDRVAFKQIYYWLRLYDSFLSEPMSFNEIDFEKVYAEYYNGQHLIYRYEDGGIVFQP